MTMKGVMISQPPVCPHSLMNAIVDVTAVVAISIPAYPVVRDQDRGVGVSSSSTLLRRPIAETANATIRAYPVVSAAKAMAESAGGARTDSAATKDRVIGSRTNALFHLHRAVIPCPAAMAIMLTTPITGWAAASTTSSAPRPRPIAA